MYGRYGTAERATGRSSWNWLVYSATGSDQTDRYLDDT